jgi:hypothetical protein
VKAQTRTPRPPLQLVKPDPGVTPESEATTYFCGSTLADVDLPVREVLAANAAGQGLLRRRMLYHVAAKPGIGKTQMMVAQAVAASLGAEALGFQWTRPYNALYLDLELPAVEMQGRYKAELRGRTGSDRFRLVSSDSLERPLGALYAPEGPRRTTARRTGGPARSSCCRSGAATSSWSRRST